jgi:hypothetical protein
MSDGQLNEVSLVVGLTGVWAAFINARERAERFARDSDAVVCTIPITFDGRRWETKMANGEADKPEPW